MSLRKEKAARLKLAILEEALRLIGRKPFQDLFVEDICARVKISKVTFFKYFPQKEDLLAYHFRIWCLARAVELKQNPKVGIQGIYFLAEKLAEATDAHPGIMLSLVGYLSDLKRTHKPFPVKPEEKSQLHPSVKNLESVEVHSLEIMVESFVLEAIFKKRNYSEYQHPGNNTVVDIGSLWIINNRTSHSTKSDKTILPEEYGFAFERVTVKF